MIMHLHHKSDLSEGSDEFAHFAGSRLFCQRGSDFDNVFFLLLFLVDEGRDIRTNDGPTFNACLVTL